MSHVEHFDRLAGRYDTLRAPPGVTAVHELSRASVLELLVLVARE